MINTKLHKRIDEILWKEWDPIGVNGFGPRDEYYSYLPDVYQLIVEKKSEEDLVEYLIAIEKEKMGLKGNRNRCADVVKSLMKARNELLDE